MYSSNEKAVIWLSLFDLTPAKVGKLFALYPNPSQILENLLIDKTKIKEIVGEDNYFKMTNTEPNLLESYIENLEKQNIKCLTICSENYPEKLREIAEPPAILFCKGDLDLLNKKALAVVGTRMPTAYARSCTQDFVQDLAKKGLVIISGLASGVDKIAHETALKVNGKTIAILGGGFSHIYPALNINLAKEISEKGLLISEYRPNVPATKYSFPYRNRLISGLSDAVLITEAGEKSGSLHTKNYALEQGKELFLIPGNINNPRALGSNKVLRALQGAMVISPDDIAIHFGLPLGTVKEVKQEQTNVNESIILKALTDGEQTLESLQEITKLETKTLNSCLTIMQIRGLIQKLPANSFCLR